MALGEFVEDHRRERDPSVIGLALPAVVDGVPLLDLARLALGAAEAYGVTRPAGVRAVVTTQTALDAQWPTAPEAAGPAYVVVLHGRFDCGSCGTALPTSTTTTDPSPVPVSTMVLELPLPLAAGATTGVAVGVGAPPLAQLGRVYDLDPYLRSLAGASVTVGPVPG